ncbi:MAG TPA: FHA domain-containing protein [Pyrinomonadaceae bacterium]|nr:FHA domain-containing protein [Pyrinomonadaceae bacterium]
MTATNQYIIVRSDLPIDPITIISDGLLIGRLPECEVLLNHPSVSRVQAGIKQVEDAYYLFPLRARNPVLLNGKPVEENEALASGDLLEAGPFQLEIEIGKESLLIRVELQIGMGPSEIDVSDAGLSTAQLVMPDAAKAKKPRAAPVASTKALDIFWDKRMREVAKMARPSPLFPRARRRTGKAQSNWTATTDLVSRWPVSFFVWGFVVVGLISIAGAYWYTQAYSPAPLSSAHEVDRLRITPAIAASANAGSCTSCHSWSGNMEQQCASCHKTDAFVATVIKPHEAAGIGCVDCHAEHKGRDFSAKAGGLASCTACHTDSNSASYNGKRVGTPHGGTFGYPVVNGEWSAKSINDEEWELRKLPVVRLATDSDQKWRSNQFHALHDQRVKVVAGIKGNSEGRLSCNSCHKSFDPIDRETPRTTCAACHNESQKELGKPNCTSCHVQHIHDQRRWSTEMLAAK